MRGRWNKCPVGHTATAIPEPWTGQRTLQEGLDVDNVATVSLTGMCVAGGAGGNDCVRVWLWWMQRNLNVRGAGNRPNKAKLAALRGMREHVRCSF